MTAKTHANDAADFVRCAQERARLVAALRDLLDAVDAEYRQRGAARQRANDMDAAKDQARMLLDEVANGR